MTGPTSRVLEVREAEIALVAVPGAAAVALLDRAREGLQAAAVELDAGARWTGAHLAALRAATAVLAVRGRPGPARSRPRSVWQVLPRLAPELTEWAQYLGTLGGPAGAHQPGHDPARHHARHDARQADDLLRDAEQFLRAVSRCLGLPWRPVLPDVVPGSR
ncbi:SAV_6107 family HEPN domain-containing protein [Aquipuribacter sp. SD81]|uniref:SAV_6107 family HEPN domain-containing protein n=1 Tax=Aquipuribacter sp. SD81 TaxID=3127703 RepID=UPI00301961C7